MPVSPDKNRSPKTSVRAIADELGVSAMTVSRAINGKGDIAEDTRQRILEAAKRLKYRPNRLVEAVMTGRSGTVGVMISPLKSFNVPIIHGIHDELVAHRSLPILHFHNAGPEANRDNSELKYIHRLLDQRVDGIIVWPSDETVPNLYLREVWERGVPLVAVDRNLPRTKADFSGTDDAAGGRIAAEHLLGLGHRRLAHIGGEPWVSTYAGRRAGFERAVAEAGLRPSIVECSDCDCYDTAFAMLQKPDRPTAIFAASDRMARHIYRAAEALLLTVGRDLSVVGFADLEETRSLIPTLTTLRQDPYAIGREAARLVLARIEGNARSSRPWHRRLVPELVVRGSTAPPHHPPQL